MSKISYGIENTTTPYELKLDYEPKFPEEELPSYKYELSEPATTIERFLQGKEIYALPFKIISLKELEKSYKKPEVILPEEREVIVIEKGSKTFTLKDAETLVAYLFDIEKVLTTPHLYESSSIYRKSLLDTINALDERLRSSQIPKLVKRGISITREYLKETIIKAESGRVEEARTYVKRALEVTSMMKQLLQMKEEIKGFGNFIDVEDLVKVDEINGVPVYSIKQE